MSGTYYVLSNYITVWNLARVKQEATSLIWEKYSLNQYTHNVD